MNPKHTLMTTLMLGLLVSLMSLPAVALIKPRSLPQDSRIKVVPYEPNNVVSIVGSTFNTTQVIFDQGEFIENIQGGDPGAWSADVQKQLPNMLFLKANIPNSRANLLVVTNRRTYYFQLKSMSAHRIRSNQVTYAVKFIYPEAMKAKQLAQLHHERQQQAGKLNLPSNPSHYHWNYSFSGDKRLVPLHIFDDGQFTYFELRPGQVVPAIFAVDNKAGKEAVVNFRRKGQYLVVQQVAPQFTLRNGQDEVASVFNNRLVRQLQMG